MNKLTSSLSEAIRNSGLQSGMTVSFHHHLRNGDHVLNMVMAEIAALGIEGLTVNASSLFDVHAPLAEHIRRGVVRKLQTNYMSGALGRFISEGNMEEPVEFRTHGGRPRDIAAGITPIDVAFIAAPASDPMGNCSGKLGRSACGSLGYAVPVSGTMLVCASSYQRVQAATKIVQDLNALGFDLTLKSVDYEEYLTLLRAGNFDLYYGEVRLSPNFDLSPFFQSGGSLTYGSLADSTMQSLCNRMLVNSGNSYNLYQRLCDRGYLTPVMFKNYAVYTTRGSVTEPARYIDWLLPAPETVTD